MRFQREGRGPLDPYNDLRAPFPELVEDEPESLDQCSRSLDLEHEHADRWQRLGEVTRAIVSGLTRNDR